MSSVKLGFLLHAVLTPFSPSSPFVKYEHILSDIQQESLWWRETCFSKVPALPSRPCLCSADPVLTLPTPQGSCALLALTTHSSLPNTHLLYTFISGLSPVKHFSESNPWALNCTHCFRFVHLLQEGCLLPTLVFLKDPPLHAHPPKSLCCGPSFHLPPYSFSLLLVLHCFLLVHGSPCYSSL